MNLLRGCLRILLAALLLSTATPCSARSLWSDTKPAINISHVFEGEINRAGKAVGFHSRPGGLDPANARLVRTQAGPNRAGIYTARVSIRDPRTNRWQEKFSTLYPDNLDRAGVIEAILHAWQHRHPQRTQPWQGPSGLGFDIQGYLNRQGEINTAFPIYRKE